MKISRESIDHNTVRLIDKITSDFWDLLVLDGNQTASLVSLVAMVAEVRGVLELGEELKKVLDV